MRIYQNQIYRKDDRTIRIVHIERLSVEYKETIDSEPEKAKHLTATKKEFCRMVKQAELISGEQK
ncbi:MAG: hypothetical protein AAF226_08995 [Verrucomicrobiota bacterium]